ncbi:hypothetical protein GPALN_011209 [Globodera pallida]|nr:hypothetical protein GPALN_011209 [Globodera pallida]
MTFLFSAFLTFCWSLVLLEKFAINCSELNNFELLIVAVATENTDGLKRLNHSANAFGLQLLVVGMGKTWNGGDMRKQGGAQKIRILREELEPYRNRDDLILLFTDAYDVILNADSDTILRKFLSYFPESRIVFGAEPFCWPDRTLASKYPSVVFGERYLNSGMFIGFVREVLSLLEIAKELNLRDDDDDQLFYTRVFLNPNFRTQFGITLDSMSYIFQNLNGMEEFVGIAPQSVHEDSIMLENFLYNTSPLVLHGNAFQYSIFSNRAVFGVPSPEFSATGIAVFVLKPIPYVEEFFRGLENLEYPKKNVRLRIYNNQPYNQQFIENWSKRNHGFALVEIYDQKEVDEHKLRADAVQWSMEINADFLLLIDADVHITAPDMLNTLIQRALEENNYRAILAPLILRPETLYSNFWGAVSESGYYARSFDYLDIIHGKLPGVWNVPFVGSAILVSKRKFSVLLKAYFWNTAVDGDISMAQFCRENGHFMFVDSTKGPHYFGFLVNSDTFSQLPKEARINLELYDFPNNKKLWESRFIHPEYFSILKPEGEVPLACPDVYDFPFLSERFCREIIEVMEEFGKWSEGKNQDRRIQGGYENVPTRDIHMNQVGFERHWLQILDNYVAPMQEKVFIGFYQRPIHANMMFVVRYRPDEQASLRPHHDASTYSIDVALNRKDVDYEGGGVRYVRYNCTVPADRVGWSMLFPGRLTHLHEGLPTTRGTRYILVSFINP